MVTPRSASVRQPFPSTRSGSATRSTSAAGGAAEAAAAAGTPTLGLFGPSDDRLYAPWGPRAVALRTPRSFEAFKAVDPELNQAINHMRDLPVDWVKRAARELLARTDPTLFPPPRGEGGPAKLVGGGPQP